MSGDMNFTQKIYNTGDVAKLLEVKDSTVRKYAQTLEKAGYKFHKMNMDIAVIMIKM